MDTTMYDSHLQRQVEQKIHTVVSNLVDQLLIIPAVKDVEVTGHLGVTINKHFKFSVFPNPKISTEIEMNKTTACEHSSIDENSVNSAFCLKEEEQICDTDKQGMILITSHGENQTKPDPNIHQDGSEVQPETSCKVLETHEGTATYMFKHETTSQRHTNNCSKATTSNTVIQNLDGSLDPTDNFYLKPQQNLQRHHRAATSKTSPQTQPVRKSRRSKKPTSRPDMIFMGALEQDAEWLEQTDVTLSVEDEVTGITETVESAARSDSHKGSEKIDKMTQLQCSICDKTYPVGKRSAFTKHVKNHGQAVQCETCGKWLSSAYSLKHHQRGLHSSQRPPYTCKLCGESFRFYHSYKLHGYKHSGRRPHVCSHCSKSYLTSSHLKAHVVSAHSKGRDRRPQYQCETCGRSFVSAGGLKNHRFRHSDTKPWCCDICSKGFSSKSALRLHSKSVHVTGRNFECDICHKFFKSEHIRNIHRRRHGGGQRGQFICDVCGRQFLFKSSLKVHFAVHQSACPYTCNICGKGFKLLPSLNSHRYTHTTERPFQCSLCPKVFKSKRTCTAHERRHNATKSFRCQHCDSTFPDKGGLGKHTRTIHAPTKMFQCIQCGKIGPRMDNMRTHVKSHGRDRTMQELNACIKEIAN